MKLCVFQGTFNPIHNAHLAMANWVKDNLDFDTILFIPAYKPPHKEFDDDLATHRYAMVKLAIDGEPAFNISNIEYQNSKYSYTYLTILELYKRYKIEGKISFIIGSDAFFEFVDWYEAQKLKELIEFIVFSRDDEMDKARLLKMRERGYNFKMAGMNFINVSSSMLRERIKKGKPVDKIIPAKVLEYIRENELYKE